MDADERKKEDRQLIQSARSGDEKAFEILLKKYRNLVYSVMVRMVRNPQEAEDLTQEAFIKAFGALQSFNDEYAFSTWLMKIASNNCIDFLRKKKLRTQSIDEPVKYKDESIQFELPDREPTPERKILDSERSRMINKAIEALPKSYREVIILRHKEEKSYEEIAELLQLPLGTVKARIFRAREMLNKSIRDIF
jgi:RNA polymerase sigma-70 factor (ECF subfamily)